MIFVKTLFDIFGFYAILPSIIILYFLSERHKKPKRWKETETAELKTSEPKLQIEVIETKKKENIYDALNWQLAIEAKVKAEKEALEAMKIELAEISEEKRIHSYLLAPYAQYTYTYEFRDENGNITMKTKEAEKLFPIKNLFDEDTYFELQLRLAKLQGRLEVMYTARAKDLPQRKEKETDAKIKLQEVFSVLDSPEEKIHYNANLEDLEGFTLQHGFIFGFIDRVKPFVCNGTIFDKYVNVYFLNNVGNWERRRVYAENELYVKIEKIIKKNHGKITKEYATSMQIENFHINRLREKGIEPTLFSSNGVTSKRKAKQHSVQMSNFIKEANYMQTSIV